MLLWGQLPPSQLPEERPCRGKGSSLQAFEAWGGEAWVGKIPWRRAWQPTLVFLPGESHGQRILVGYSP